jgi:hypothetical protein
MFTTFTPLIAVGWGFRLVLNWGLRRHFDLAISIPQADKTRKQLDAAKAKYIFITGPER